MKAVIDYDIFLYEIGFTGQQSIWKAGDSYYETKTEAKKDGHTEFEEIVEPAPWYVVRKMVDNRIHQILNAVDCDEYVGYLTGKGNFREKVATILKYKGNRSGVKPYHYENIKEHLIDCHLGHIVKGIEADDMVAYVGRGNVICSRDKDLRQVAGYHYSWPVANQPEKELYTISELEGERSFYKQMLTGDTIDNILGVPSIGERKADKILEGANTIQDLRDAVMDTYETMFGPIAVDGKIYYQSWDGSRMWKTPQELFEENYTLLRMLTTQEQIERYAC